MSVKIDGTGYIGTANNIYTNSSGYVGIGTSSPSAKLAIQAAGADGLVMEKDSNSTGNSGRMFFLADGTNFAMCATANTLSFFTGSIPGNSTGTQRVLLDGSGRITMPYQPAFSASLSSAWNIGSSGVNTIPFASANFNTGSCYNTSTYRFTVPVAGKYLFMCNLGSSSTTSTYTYFGILVYVNGVQILNGWQNKGFTTSSYVCDSKTLMLNLSLNDYVEFKLEVSGAIAVSTGVVCGQLIS